MSKAWIFQATSQIKKYGPDKASHYVGWLDPAGKRCSKSCGPGSEGKRNAERLRRKIEAELLTGTYEAPAKLTWEKFRAEFVAKIVGGMSDGTGRLTLDALDNFERIIKPVKLAGIKTQTIDDYIAARKQERGQKKGSLLSAATINKDLRHLRATLRIAHDWGYLPVIPKFRMVREPGKLPTYITPEHFAAIYAACEYARYPAQLPCSAPDWWRGLLVMAYMTGWRISELLALAKEDLDLEAGTAVTRAKDNKGKRDEKIHLHPVVVEHLKRLTHFEEKVFPWKTDIANLYSQFQVIQEKAGVHLPCSEKHEHTARCHVYGFHDLRRAFATLNAEKLSADALQMLMRHKSYATTKRYINMSRQINQSVAALYVPDVLQVAKANG